MQHYEQHRQTYEFEERCSRIAARRCSVCKERRLRAGRLRNLLMTTAGAVTYIISGSATLTFYIPQVKMKQNNNQNT